MRLRSRIGAVALAAVALVACSSSDALSSSPKVTTPGAQWLAGDIHNHTFLTDGSHPEAQVVWNAFGRFGLDYLTNSEHGGTSARDTTGAAPAAGGLGDTASATNAVLRTPTQRWRWETLRDASYPLLLGPTGLQSQYPDQLLIQGVEWNVPTHEHASVGLLAAAGRDVSDFEYQFDASDRDRSRDSGWVSTVDTTAGATTPVRTAAAIQKDRFGNDLVKRNVTHADAVAGAAYLEAHYATSAYVVINHPSRQQRNSAAHLRDLNEAAPHVVIGIEGFPGHQKEAARGGYGNGPFYDATNATTGTTDTTHRARTYGGADYMLAKVGGLMDSLWGEGRRFWVFLNSDFHSAASSADFWPGEYAKTWIYARGRTPADVMAGMKSGNVFIAHGDLVERLDVSVTAGGQSATLGGELVVAPGTQVTVTVKLQSPTYNHNGDAPRVDHVDVITGAVTGKKDRTDAVAWASETNPSAAVAKRFTSADWTSDGAARTMSWTYTPSTSGYVRLRGTNQRLGGAKLDANGDPRMDEANTTSSTNTIDKAWADLWFYTNPVFVTVR
jgi:hypothetical protein